MNTSPDSPDDLRWKACLANHIPDRASWERRSCESLRTVSSFREFLRCLSADDPNTRIVTAQMLGVLNSVLSDSQRYAAIDALLQLLTDSACNEYEYGSWQSDEDSSISVRMSAAESLVVLGYASDVDSALKGVNPLRG